MSGLKGKVVIMTGASSGFGAEAGAAVCKRGMQGCAGGASPRPFGGTCQGDPASGGDALPVEMDVSQLEQIEAMVKSTLKAFGRIDILFNNAGFGRLDWLEALEPVKDIQAQITVDLLGVIWTARAVLPYMYKQRSGHIINMCSMGGWAAPPLYTIYSAAKFGVRGFSEALRRESTPMGVKVSVIYPGGASTEFQKHMGQNEAKKRFKTPDWLKLSAMDVARSVVGLAKWPRRNLITPWWMVFSIFFNSHFSGLSDAVQASAFAPYHKIEKE